MHGFSTRAHGSAKIAALAALPGSCALDVHEVSSVSARMSVTRMGISAQSLDEYLDGRPDYNARRPSQISISGFLDYVERVAIHSLATCAHYNKQMQSSIMAFVHKRHKREVPHPIRIFKRSFGAVGLMIEEFLNAL
ncbi:hypothetical protein BDR06DRAFT_992867 [Suillus hirtellus]|nr:hypothetical protein BDR06DRAFT_992867 [Suillus hirtellus]